MKNAGMCLGISFLSLFLARQDHEEKALPLMKLKTEWAGYTKELIGPCRSVPSEIEIADDIRITR